LQARADNFNRGVVYEAFDMLAGRLAPELGGSRAHLGVVGLNYYAGNQWTIATSEEPQRFLSIDDPAWFPLPLLLQELERRYGGGLVIAETGASGDDRSNWLSYLATEARRALDQGVNLQGICFYPLVTSPDWEDPTAFFDGGLFDVMPEPDGTLRRVRIPLLLKTLRAAQADLDPENLTMVEPTIDAAAKQWDLTVLNPIADARFKADNFSYRAIAVGDFLQVEVYGLEPGTGIPAHRHPATEHVLTVSTGSAEVIVAGTRYRLATGESLLVPASVYYGVHNPGSERLVFQQVSGPKPWNARFAGPQPTGFRAMA
jgi:quercetin dioxygenase-like cupin family protein